MLIALGIFLALLPGFAWLIFYLHEDLHPEPKTILALVFSAGGLFAFLALATQVILQKNGLIVDPVATAAAYDALPWWPFILSILALSLVEELFKFGAAYFTVHKRPEFDEPVDAMVYMVVAALGFATVENIGAILPQPGQAAFLSSVYETLSLRFVGATLLHALASAILGYFWAISIRDFGATRFILWGVLLATLLHAAFNYLIIIYGNLMYTLVFVLVAGLVVLHDFEKLKVKSI